MLDNIFQLFKNSRGEELVPLILQRRNSLSGDAFVISSLELPSVIEANSHGASHMSVKFLSTTKTYFSY